MLLFVPRLVKLSIVLFLVVINGSILRAQAVNIKAFRLYTNDDQILAELKTDGAVFILGKQVGMLSKDGLLSNLDDQTLATINLYGTVKSAKRKNLFEIDYIGRIRDKSGSNFYWNEENKMMLSADQYLYLEPYSADLRKTASFLFGMYAQFGEKLQSP